MKIAANDCIVNRPSLPVHTSRVSWFDSKPRDDKASLQCGLHELLKAYELAIDAAREKWDFAVELKVLRRCGLNESDFRWLVSKGIVEHACEITAKKDDKRRFRPTNPLRFKKHTCFVLTEEFAERLSTNEDLKLGPTPLENTGHDAEPLPRWDRGRHELYVSDFLVKRYKWPARNQETVLAAFEEDKWPAAGIYDPLPPHERKDSKQRLRDTIKCLNRYQTNRFIHFRGDGTGQRVIWEFTAAAIEVIDTACLPLWSPQGQSLPS